MKFLNRWSVGTRQIAIAVISGVITCSCVGAGSVALHQLGRSAQAAFEAKDVVADVLPPPMYLVELRLAASQALEGSISAQTLHDEIQRHEQTYQARAAFWSRHLPSARADELFGRSGEQATRLFELSRAVVADLKAGRADAARRQLSQLEALFQKHRTQVDTTVATGLRLASASQQEFERTAWWGQVALVAILAGGIVGLTVLSWLVSRSIVRPLRRAVEVAEAVASGDLTRQQDVEGRDESARLITALNRMCASLAEMVGHVRQSSLRVAEATTQLAAGNQDLKQRTQAHQAELESTTQSLREITGMVEQNARSAQDANALVQTVSSAADLGGAAMNDVTTTMEGISVASHRVGDIVGVIESIAFQTNLLALNAAVEAARAGEQGRGFAVVAGEVRQLANRSSTAAREIRQLAGNSTQRVTEGSAQAQGAHASIREMVSQVNQMSALVSGIWETTFAQSSGINLLVEAVDVLAQAADSNVALVTQTAGLSNNLQADAAALADIVGRFRLPCDAQRVDRSPALA